MTGRLWVARKGEKRIPLVKLASHLPCPNKSSAEKCSSVGGGSCAELVFIAKKPQVSTQKAATLNPFRRLMSFYAGPQGLTCALHLAPRFVVTQPGVKVKPEELVAALRYHPKRA